MQVIGLLSTEEEAREIQYVAKIYALEYKIHQIVRFEKLKKIMEEKH